jgi:hypothetical protein
MELRSAFERVVIGVDRADARRATLALYGRA